LVLIKELYYDARPNKSQDSCRGFAKTYRSQLQGSFILNSYNIPSLRTKVNRAWQYDEDSTGNGIRWC